jgi:predicted methyltransferase
MRKPLIAACIAAAMLGTSGCATLSAEDQATQGDYAALSAAIAAPHRTQANTARDRYRNPLETLSFFGVQPNHTVVEIWPGGGWYTEILAPYLAPGGNYYAATPLGRGTERFQAFTTANPSLYGKVRSGTFPMRDGGTPVPAGSADVVLTFRNVHNWMMGDTPFADDAFRQMYAMLKPGGTLGVVEHRLSEGTDSARERTSGYVKTSTVRRLAEQAGFRFVSASEINANPRDTKDHPDGVWSLPPTFRGGDKDRDRFMAVGESDRMTLKFVKPKA